MQSSQNGNIKVICRFRPIIDIELEHSDTSASFFSFPSDEAVLTTDGECFTYDKVFSPSSSQKELFENVGGPIVEDVLTGYNGTVLAYGQTGSGKSYTMMGLNLYDQNLKGIIPRAVSSIFTFCEKSYKNIEFTLKCSMLEIYKETLKDLLGNTHELKIKEDVYRGIYVQGLNEVYLTSEEETMTALAVGERNRTVASTKMNSASSRSHQLFIMEVKQKMQNGTEKRGILNLVDLAGSEKISQSGVTGNKLEEAKKINLSLSALSNVIKALTSHAEHIPYRDSKLTRLLQESLGGNYKTTLVINCSPHPRNTEDTLNTLKFAQRAKRITNKVRLNIKKSVEAYIKIIEDLKLQLQQASTEIERLKSNKTLHKCLTFGTNKDTDDQFVISNDHSSIKDSLVSEESSEIENFKEELSQLKVENLELKNQIIELKESLNKETNKRITEEKRFFEYCVEQFASHQANKCKDGHQKDLEEENQNLKLQVHLLIDHINKISERFKGIIDNAQKGEAVSEWGFNKVSLNLDNLCNYTADSPLVVEENELESVIDIEFDPETMLKNDLYTQKICMAIEESSKINSDFTIFQLKKQIITSGLLNCELLRNYYELQWREKLVKEKYNLKAKLLLFNEYKIASLEKILDKMQRSYSKLIEIIERSSKICFSSIPEGGVKANIVRPVNFNSSCKPNIIRRNKRGNTTGPSNSDSAPRKGSLIDENDTVKFRALKSGFQLQTLLNQQLSQDLETTKNERNTFKSLYTELQLQHLQVYEKEKQRWGNYFDSFKEISNKELLRRQAEINNLNQQIGHWMTLYLQSQGKKAANTTDFSYKEIKSEVSDPFSKFNFKESPFTSRIHSKRLSMVENVFGDCSPPIYDDL